jgi:hypothetical protein
MMLLSLDSRGVRKHILKQLYHTIHVLKYGSVSWASRTLWTNQRKGFYDASEMFLVWQYCKHSSKARFTGLILETWPFSQDGDTQ